MAFITFMRSTLGRAARIGVGLVLMLFGINQVGGTLGLLLAAVGIVPIVAGVFNFCLAAPLFGFDINGRPRAGGAR